MELAALSAFAEQPDAQAALEGAGAEFSAVVLTSGLWPKPPPCPDVALPGAPARLQEMFATFYAAQHKGRSLRWAQSLGQCLLRASYTGGRRELVVSQLQAIVLLLFNAADVLTCAEIAQATRMPAADLHRRLQSLALHKT
eukprot:1614893-Heterocapsa_arctica.AAC.1